MDFRLHEVSIAYSILSTSGKFFVAFHIPQSLICSHEGVHETVGRVVDMLEFAVGVRRFVGVSADRIASVQGHERHDFILKIFVCCSMAK